MSLTQSTDFMQDLCNKSLMNVPMTVGLGISPLQPQQFPWIHELVRYPYEHREKLQAIMQTYPSTVMAPIDPKIKAICDDAEREIEAMRAQLIEAAKKAPPAAPAIDGRVKTIVAEVAKKEAQLSPNLPMQIRDAGKTTHCAQCTNYTDCVLCDECRNKDIAALDARIRGDYLREANESFNRRENRELKPGGAFRWTYRMS